MAKEVFRTHLSRGGGFSREKNKNDQPAFVGKGYAYSTRSINRLLQEIEHVQHLETRRLLRKKDKEKKEEENKRS